MITKIIDNRKFILGIKLCDVGSDSNNRFPSKAYYMNEFGLKSKMYEYRMIIFATLLNMWIYLMLDVFQVPRVDAKYHYKTVSNSYHMHYPFYEKKVNNSSLNAFKKEKNAGDFNSDPSVIGIPTNLLSNTSSHQLNFLQSELTIQRI